MGVVYEAEQISLGRRVALKVLPGHLAADRKALERFRHEAHAAARLHRTNIVPVFEVGRQGEIAFAPCSSVSRAQVAANGSASEFTSGVPSATFRRDPDSRGSIRQIGLQHTRRQAKVLYRRPMRS